MQLREYIQLALMSMFRYQIRKAQSHPKQMSKEAVAEPNVKIHELARDISAIRWLGLFPNVQGWS